MIPFLLFITGFTLFWFVILWKPLYREIFRLDREARNNTDAMRSTYRQMQVRHFDAWLRQIGLMAIPLVPVMMFMAVPVAIVRLIVSAFSSRDDLC